MLEEISPRDVVTSPKNIAKSFHGIIEIGSRCEEDLLFFQFVMTAEEAIDVSISV